MSKTYADKCFQMCKCQLEMSSETNRIGILKYCMLSKEKIHKHANSLYGLVYLFVSECGAK